MFFRRKIKKAKDVELILNKIIEMLFDMGFEETIITNPYRSFKSYVCGEFYCIPQYVEMPGFLIEYAHTYEEAKAHGYEDGDSFPLSMGETVILEGLKKELEQNIES